MQNKKQALRLTLMLTDHHLTVIGTSACAVRLLYHFLHKYFGVCGKAPIDIVKKDNLRHRPNIEIMVDF